MQDIILFNSISDTYNYIHMVKADVSKGLKQNEVNII